MAKIIPGRYTTQIEGPFVVFLIGMRINRLYAIHKWLPTMLAMGPMLSSLFRRPEQGFLGVQTFFYWRGIATVQYWRSFADLERFSKNPRESHLPAWRRYTRRIGNDGSVGIWHETYLVQAGQYETVYGNMPVFGLARATAHLPATGRRETARRRLGYADSEPEAAPSPVPPLAAAIPGAMPPANASRSGPGATGTGD